MTYHKLNTVQIISAEPGWEVLYPLRGPDERVRGFEPVPVIAWELEIVDRTGVNGDRHTLASPVTAEGSVDESPLLLRQPDGRILAPGEGFLDAEYTAGTWLNERLAEESQDASDE